MKKTRGKLYTAAEAAARIGTACEKPVSQSWVSECFHEIERTVKSYTPSKRFTAEQVNIVERYALEWYHRKNAPTIREWMKANSVPFPKKYVPKPPAPVVPVKVKAAKKQETKPGVDFRDIQIMIRDSVGPLVEKKFEEFFKKQQRKQEIADFSEDASRASTFIAIKQMIELHEKQVGEIETDLLEYLRHEIPRALHRSSPIDLRGDQTMWDWIKHNTRETFQVLSFVLETRASEIMEIRQNQKGLFR